MRSGAAHAHACCTPWYAADSRHAVLHTHLADPKGHSSSRRPASHQIRKGQAPAGDSVLYRSVRPYSLNAQIQRPNDDFPDCSTYNLQAMQAYLAARPAYHRTHPRMFDTECLHTPYLPPPTPGPHGISSLSAHRNSPRLKPASGAGHVPEGDLLNLGNDYSSGAAAPHKRATSPSQSPSELKRRPGFSKRPGSGRKKSASGSTTSKDNTAADGMTDSEREEDDDLEEEWIPDVFLFEYGCVVLWGMTEKEEKKFLASMCVFFLSIQSSGTSIIWNARADEMRNRKRFEIERLSAEDVEMEDLNFYYADYSRYAFFSIP